MHTTPTGLQYEDTIEGTGAVAAKGHNVKVHYTGWLYNNATQGAQFDSSKEDVYKRQGRIWAMGVRASSRPVGSLKSARHCNSLISRQHSKGLTSRPSGLSASILPMTWKMSTSTSPTATPRWWRSMHAHPPTATPC